MKKFKAAGMDKEEIRCLIIALRKIKITSGSKGYIKATKSLSGKEELRLKNSKYYKEKIGVSP